MDSERVLIIEDTQSFALMLKQLVSINHGYEVDIAESVAATTQILDQQSELYFAAIVDLNLPDGPSGEALPLVSEAGIPAIVFTAMSDRTMEDDLWAKGIADYAHKSGTHSLEYVVWMLKRLHNNREIGVLVVDDSLVARKGMERLLKIQQFQVYSASSSDEALATLDQHDDIKLVITDCYMEGTDGFELSRKIRSKFSKDELEIIGVSSKGSASLSAQFIKAGANDFLVKPFLPEEFFCRVNHCVDRIEVYQQLKQLNQTKNELLGTAAHDIRGPVGAIMTAANFLLKGRGNEDRRRQFMEMIASTSKEVLDLLSTLLDVSAIEQGKIELHCENSDMGKLIEERIELYSNDAQAKSIRFDTDFGDNLVANIDSIKVKQVVDNLITNAIKFSPQQGVIQMRAFREGECLTVEVRDQGAGVAKEEVGRLFKAYSTTSTRATAGEKQTGLGLAIARRIAEAHQGSLSYIDNENGGACFVFQMKSQ